MNKNTFFPLVTLDQTNSTTALFQIGERTLCAGSWHVYVFDTKEKKELTNAVLDIYIPHARSSEVSAILKAKELPADGLLMHRDGNTERFLFRMTYIKTLYRVPYKEYFIVWRGPNDTGPIHVRPPHCTPVSYQLADSSPAALNIYSEKGLPEDLDIDVLCKNYLRGERATPEYMSVTGVETIEEAIASLKAMEKIGGHIGAIVFDNRYEVKVIECQHMHVDMRGIIVCGMALGDKGHGGEHLDGCIIGGYTPPDFCPEF